MIVFVKTKIFASAHQSMDFRFGDIVLLGFDELCSPFLLHPVVLLISLSETLPQLIQ